MSPLAPVFPGTVVRRKSISEHHGTTPVAMNEGIPVCVSKRMNGSCLKKGGNYCKKGRDFQDKITHCYSYSYLMRLHEKEKQKKL